MRRGHAGDMYHGYVSPFLRARIGDMYPGYVSPFLRPGIGDMYPGYVSPVSATRPERDSQRHPTTAAMIE